MLFGEGAGEGIVIYRSNVARAAKRARDERSLDAFTHGYVVGLSFSRSPWQVASALFDLHVW
jgi:hypothetical protein